MHSAAKRCRPAEWCTSRCASQSNTGARANEYSDDHTTSTLTPGPSSSRCSFCYPHNLLGKIVGRDITQEERDDEIRKEDNLRDLYYYAYRPTPAKPHGTDQRSLVVDLRRRLLPTDDDLARFNPAYGATRNELAALVEKVRKHEYTDWYAKPIKDAIDQMEVIDAPGQRLYELLQRPEFRVHRERLNEVKQDAQHVATCMRRVTHRLNQLGDDGSLDKARRVAEGTVELTPLVQTLRGLLAPEECASIGLDDDDTKRAMTLDTGTDARPHLRLRRLLAAFGSRAFVCRNGV